jgi:hypothetical protein
MHRHHSTHPRVAASRAHEETLPLFAWAISWPDNHQPLTLPRAAHVVARRFGLPAARARVVAELAGISLEAAPSIGRALG